MINTDTNTSRNKRKQQLGKYDVIYSHLKGFILLQLQTVLGLKPDSLAHTASTVQSASPSVSAVWTGFGWWPQCCNTKISGLSLEQMSETRANKIPSEFTCHVFCQKNQSEKTKCSTLIKSLLFVRVALSNRCCANEHYTMNSNSHLYNKILYTRRTKIRQFMMWWTWLCANDYCSIIFGYNLNRQCSVSNAG